MTIKDALSWGFETLGPTSTSARLDAEILLAHTLKWPKTFLLTHDRDAVGFVSLWLYRRLIRLRKEGIPVAYLTGRKEFYSLDFEVNRNTLVPRPDTEILVESVITYLGRSEIRNAEIRKKAENRNHKSEIQKLLLLDIGTGSGCIPISILKNVPGLRAVATDVSGAALRTAERNARRLGVGDRIQFLKSNLLESIPDGLFSGHDAVVTANLPYLPDQIAASPELRFEPSIALYSGSDGMTLYKKFAQQLNELRPRAIFVELFGWQAELFSTWMTGYEKRSVERMGGEARCLALLRG